MSKSNSAVLELARSALDKPVEFSELLAKAAQKDRNNVEKHLAALEAEHGSPRASLWRKLTRSLGTLAPLAITTVGQHAIQFFIPDGKYRMQVFALEDKQDGQVAIYVPDILAEAIKMRVLARGEQDGRYSITAAKGQDVQIDQLSGPAEINPAVHYKNMIGWNRKALRITLPAAASAQQVAVVEDLCAMAARAWKVDEGKR